MPPCLDTFVFSEVGMLERWFIQASILTLLNELTCPFYNRKQGRLLNTFLYVIYHFIIGRYGNITKLSPNSLSESLALTTVYEPLKTAPFSRTIQIWNMNLFDTFWTHLYSKSQFGNDKALIMIETSRTVSLAYEKV